MTDAVKFPNLKGSDRRRDVPCRGEPVASTPVAPESRFDIERHDARADELDRLHRALRGVTPETHPRTARLLASSTRKTAQKVIEEAGEVAIEAVRRNAGGIVRESADLLYHLVALWRRVGIEPQQVWREMRHRADTLGIAEKLPKKSSGRAVTACGAHRSRNPAK